MPPLSPRGWTPEPGRPAEAPASESWVKEGEESDLAVGTLSSSHLSPTQGLELRGRESPGPSVALSPTWSLAYQHPPAPHVKDLSNCDPHVLGLKNPTQL